MKVKLTLTEQKKVKAFAKRLIETRTLNEGFKRDALNAISEAEDTFKRLKDLGLSDESLEKLADYITKKVNVYDEENLEFAIESFLWSEEWDEDEMLDEMENVSTKVEMRHGTERDMTNQCLLDVADAIEQFIRASQKNERKDT